MRGLGSEPRGGLRLFAGADLWKLVLGSGLLARTAGMIRFDAALNLDDISRIKPVAFTVAPAVAALLGWLALHEPMTLRRGTAIVLILAGVVLLTGDRKGPAPDPLARVPSADDDPR